MGAGIGRLLDDDTGYWAFVAGGLGALFVLYFLLKPFFDIYKAFKLRNARLTLDGELVEGYSAPQNV